jgi:hypothetical protein
VTATPISFVFAHDFPQCPHYDMGTGHRSVEIDQNLAGRTRVFLPNGKPHVTIGRHPDCFIRIGGRKNAIDSVGNSLFNRVSRIAVTIVWSEEPWLSSPQWVVLLGGVFIDPRTNEKVSIPSPPLGAWLNGGQLIADDTEPLFKNGSDISKLSIGTTGKILVYNGYLGENSTEWPKEIWYGPGWPEPTIEPSINVDPHRAALEKKILKNEPVKQIPQPKTWPDIAAIVIEGPPQVDKRLWWALWSALLTLFVYWKLE